MNQEHDVGWLNESYVCKSFDKSKYPKVKPEAIDIYNQAIMLGRSTTPPIDQVEIVNLYKQSAAMGYWPSMYNLAVHYYQGNGVAEDEQKSLYWFKEIEKLQIPESYDAMSLVYYKGIGVKKNRAKALEYANQAAKMGDPDSLVSLAKSLYPRRKFTEAYIALECAVQQNHPEATSELARNYEADKDYEKSYKYYRVGAKLGSGVCLRALAAAYENYKGYPSFGLNKDLKRAACLSKLNDKVGNNPDLKFPDLDTICPANVAQPGNRH